MGIDADPAGELTPNPDDDNEATREERTAQTSAELDETVEYPEAFGDAVEGAEVDHEPPESDGDDDPSAARSRRRSPMALAGAFGAVTVVALLALTGWLGFRAYESHQADRHRQELVEVGRQGAINLTTIDFRRADEDVARILDSATGQFYDDFSKRSQPFVDVVKQTQSTSEGAVTAAGVESETADGADILVAVTVKTTNAAAPQSEQRSWRMRVSVQEIDGQAKVSNVAFVP